MENAISGCIRTSGETVMCANLWFIKIIFFRLNIICVCKMEVVQAGNIDGTVMQ